MLVIEPKSQRIVQAGGDLKSLLGTSEPLGRSASDFLTAAACEKLRALRTNEPIRPQHLFTMERDETQIDAVVHSSGSYWVLEIDPRLENEPEDSLALVQSMIGQVQRSETVEKSYQAIVGEVRAASGFDRVMLYRFLSDGTGSVEAEARAEDVESYRGLRYPASDIPSQARALYLRNWIRLIADAGVRCAGDRSQPRRAAQRIAHSSGISCKHGRRLVDVVVHHCRWKIVGLDRLSSSLTQVSTLSAPRRI
jgi:light-regulated signal transduction histidine kinase (bacteriophytochrome)